PLEVEVGLRRGRARRHHAGARTAGAAPARNPSTAAAIVPASRSGWRHTIAGSRRNQVRWRFASWRVARTVAASAVARSVRPATAADDVGDRRVCGVPKARRLEGLARRDQVQAVVRDVGPLRRRRLRRADVEIAIDLPRVGGDDLTAQALGEVERKRALPARRRADYADEAHVV